MNDIIKLSDVIEKLADSLVKSEKEYIEQTDLARLSCTQLEYIDLIYHKENPSLSDCAKILSVSRPSVTAIIDQLDALGLVTKIKSDDDRRTSHLHLTAEGMRMAKIHDQFHHDYVFKLFGQLPASDIKKLLSILSKIFENK